MARSKAEIMRERREARGEVTGFDVTCSIGRVNFDELAETTAVEAAFLLIARHDAEGTYTFPAENGGQITVTVEF